MCHGVCFELHGSILRTANDITTFLVPYQVKYFHLTARWFKTNYKALLLPTSITRLTWGTPNQSSACCMASLAFCTGWFGSQSDQSGHRPDRTTTGWLDNAAQMLARTVLALITSLGSHYYPSKRLRLQHSITLPHAALFLWIQRGPLSVAQY